jgi:RNA polymerase sigma-70 factor (ECF subfamily)
MYASAAGLCESETMLQLHPDRVIQNPDMAEHLWVQAAQAGNLEAYNHLVQIYQDPLYHWVLHLVDDPALAEDITQITFLAAYQKLHTFHGGSLRAWLFKIARNRAYDTLRTFQRHPLTSLNESPAGEDDRELIELILADDLTPEDLAVLAEQAEHVFRVLDQLPRSFHAVLELVDLNAMEYQEAAQILNIPIGTLKSRLARARQKFREVAVQNGLFQESPE